VTLQARNDAEEKFENVGNVCRGASRVWHLQIFHHLMKNFPLYYLKSIGAKMPSSAL
jgi:hypothetical protein